MSDEMSIQPQRQASQIESNPAMFVLLCIWWSLMWRTALWIAVFIIPAILLNVVFIILLKMSGVPLASALPVTMLTGTLLGGAAGLMATLFALRRILGKTFQGHRLLLLKPEA